MTFYELRLSKMIYDNHNRSYQEDIIWINFRLINVERTMKNLEISLWKSLVKSKELLILLVVVSKICSSSIVSHPSGIVSWLDENIIQLYQMLFRIFSLSLIWIKYNLHDFSVSFYLFNLYLQFDVSSKLSTIQVVRIL